MLSVMSQLQDLFRNGENASSVAEYLKFSVVIAEE